MAGALALSFSGMSGGFGEVAGAGVVTEVTGGGTWKKYSCKIQEQIQCNVMLIFTSDIYIKCSNQYFF
jgi:hypothetical protein